MFIASDFFVYLVFTIIFSVFKLYLRFGFLGLGEDKYLGIMFTEGLDKNALRWVREVSFHKLNFHYLIFT